MVHNRLRWDFSVVSLGFTRLEDKVEFWKCKSNEKWGIPLSENKGVEDVICDDWVDKICVLCEITWGYYLILFIYILP